MNASHRVLALVALASVAMMAGGAQSHKVSHHKSGPTLALAVNSPTCGPMIGTWTLRNGDAPRTDIKMVFRPNGSFAFVGPNWQSAGTYRVGSHTLSLVWTSVDGSKVPPGSVKKDFPMADDDSSFTIDKYTYYKLTPQR